MGRGRLMAFSSLLMDVGSAGCFCSGFGKGGFYFFKGCGKFLSGAFWMKKGVELQMYADLYRLFVGRVAF